MLSAFKEQQHQYRALLDGMKVGMPVTKLLMMHAAVSVPDCCTTRIFADKISSCRRAEDAAAAQR